MSDYQLATSDPVGPVIRTTDQAHIPADPANRDWVEYQNWLALGNTPDLYVPPDPVPVPPAPEVADAVLLDHENRLRTIEGKPPLSMADFKARFTP